MPSNPSRHQGGADRRSLDIPPNLSSPAPSYADHYSTCELLEQKLVGALLAVAAAPHCRWCVQRPGDLSHRGAVEQVQQSCSLRQLCIEMANLPRSSQFRSASSLSCTRCWPWQGTVLQVISALGLELHVTAVRCQLRRRARRWLWGVWLVVVHGPFFQPPYVRRSRYWASKAVTVDRSGYVRERVGVAPVAV